MIKEYRRKEPIKAEQFDGSLEMAKKYDIERGDTGGGYEYYLLTNEGDMACDEGDWIATGVDGEHWAIADDIFRRTYEEADDNDC